MALSDAVLSILQELVSWRSVAIWLVAVIAWVLFKAGVRRAARRRSGKVGLALVPVLGVVVLLAGAADLALFLWALFALVVVVLVAARRRARVRERGEFEEFS